MAIRAGFCAKSLMLCRDIGAQDRDQSRLAALQLLKLSDPPDGLKPIHHGHLQVHQYEIKSTIDEGLNRLSPIINDG